MFQKQSIITIALAFVLGNTIYTLLASFIEDIISPLLGILFHRGGALAKEIYRVGPVRIEWGNFVTAIIETAIVSSIVFFVYKYIQAKSIKEKIETVEK